MIVALRSSKVYLNDLKAISNSSLLHVSDAHSCIGVYIIGISILISTLKSDKRASVNVGFIDTYLELGRSVLNFDE